MLKIIVALTGNRTPNSPVAGGNSTTEPPMPVISTIYPAQSHIKYCIHVKNKSCIGVESNPGLPRRDYWREFPTTATTNACII